jgi:hypothetical protein
MICDIGCTSLKSHNYLSMCGLLPERLENSAQTNLFINLLYVVDVFKTRKKQSSNKAREEMKSKYESLEHCDCYILRRNTFSLGARNFPPLPYGYCTRSSNAFCHHFNSGTEKNYETLQSHQTETLIWSIPKYEAWVLTNHMRCFLSGSSLGILDWYFVRQFFQANIGIQVLHYNRPRSLHV